MILRHNSSTISYVWERASNLLKEALEYNYDGLELGDIFNAIMENKGQLWIVEDDNIIKLAVYTEIMQGKSGNRKLKLSLVAGEGLNGMLATSHEKIAEWAKEQGCTEIEGSGREGWRTFAKVMGYHHVYTTYRKGL